MNVINPSRVLQEAIRIISEIDPGEDEDKAEEIDNVLQELAELAEVMPDQVDTQGEQLVQEEA